MFTHAAPVFVCVDVHSRDTWVTFSDGLHDDLECPEVAFRCEVQPITQEL